MYYTYQNDRITGKLDAPAETGTYCASDTDFDLDNTDVIVGMVDANHNLTYYTVKPKPVETLLKNITVYKEVAGTQITALGQQVATLTAQNAALGKQVAALTAAGKAGE